jgi:uncharacterized membrane protein YbjE (DUF340 family)
MWEGLLIVGAGFPGTRYSHYLRANGIVGELNDMEIACIIIVFVFAWLAGSIENNIVNIFHEAIDIIDPASLFIIGIRLINLGNEHEKVDV